ncbi:Transposon Ty3-G Gag-Pol poly [Labeo rohita]|uniref:Transposon Ty3-G Gag-Pol poly n=1 Tax=Labeo rohita TaxID=84645 RepID=A0A498NWA3_LABRO|nr:Transposon Ty3-G Gag-Pol poly [Labeo rohita]
MIKHPVFVIPRLVTPLLGLPAIKELNLLHTVDVIQTTEPNYKELFPKVFTGLGKLEGAYKIKLKESTTAFALSVPRRVPLPMMNKVKEEQNGRPGCHSSHLRSDGVVLRVPEVLVTDNRPQFAASDFADYAKDYNFHHVTSSPHYPQSNGEAERAVRTVKTLLRKGEDPHKALMAYRATPLTSGASPAQLLMGQNIRTTLPVNPSTLKAAWPNLSTFKKKDKALKEKQAKWYNKRHRGHAKNPFYRQDNQSGSKMYQMQGESQILLIPPVLTS